MSNMDDFNKGAAMILKRLYEAFPQEIDINVSELSSEADANAKTNYGATMEFLGREGFIRIRETVDEAYYYLGVSLTSKGLAILNSTPNVLKEKAPLGERLGGALKSGSKETVKVLVEKIVESAVSGVVKGLGQ